MVTLSRELLIFGHFLSVVGLNLFENSLTWKNCLWFCHEVNVLVLLYVFCINFVICNQSTFSPSAVGKCTLILPANRAVISAVDKKKKKKKKKICVGVKNRQASFLFRFLA